MPIRKDDYFCEIFIEKSCQKFANLSQDIAVVRQVLPSSLLLAVAKVAFGRVMPYLCCLFAAFYISYVPRRNPMAGWRSRVNTRLD